MLSMLALLVLGGAFVGLLSGLLGVGGAVIIMPLLNVFFDRLGFSVDTTQHLSLGTSLATILFTSLSSVLALWFRARRHLEKDGPRHHCGHARRRASRSTPSRIIPARLFRLLRHAGRRSSALQFHPPPQDRATRTGHASGQHTHRPDFEPCGHRRDHALRDFPGLGRDRLGRRRGHVRRPELAHQPVRNPRICHRRVELPGASSLLRRFRVPSRDVLPAGFQHEHGRCRRTAGPFAAIADAGLAPLFRGRQYPSRSFDTPLRPFQMIPTQLKKQSRSSAPAYSNTPPSLRKTLPPGERTQKIPAGKPVGMFFFAGGPSVT